MSSAERIPAVVLKRKAVVYVRQSTQSQVMTNLESQRRHTIWSSSRASGALPMRRSSTTISGCRPAAWSLAPDLTAWSLGYVPVRLEPSYASMPQGSPAMVAIGITCSNCVDWSKPVSSTSTASTILAVLTIDCFLA
jgi:hypothetical protein